jgi:hypothetical protein
LSRTASLSASARFGFDVQQMCASHKENTVKLKRGRNVQEAHNALAATAHPPELLTLLAPTGFLKAWAEKHMTEKTESSDIPSVQMERALLAYALWLKRTMADDQGLTESGTTLLAVITDLQRKCFPDATLVTGELLILHTQVANLVFEHKMSFLRGGDRSRMASPDASELASRQFAAIQRMQQVCCGQVSWIQTQDTGDGATAENQHAPAQPNSQEMRH